MDVLETCGTFRAHHWRVEEENNPRTREVAVLPKGLSLNRAQDTGLYSTK